MKANQQELEKWKAEVRSAEGITLDRDERRRRLLEVLEAIINTLITTVDGLPGWLVVILRLFTPISRILSQAMAGKEVIEKLKQ